jgi:hypothetical protein
LVVAKHDAGVAARTCASELRLEISGLRTVADKMKAIMFPIGLETAPLDDPDIAGFARFFADVSGRLEMLQPALDQVVRKLSDAAAEAAANTLLSRVHHLAPNFPFDQLLGEDEDQEVAQSAVALFVDEFLRRLWRL